MICLTESLKTVKFGKKTVFYFLLNLLNFFQKWIKPVIITRCSVLCAIFIIHHGVELDEKSYPNENEVLHSTQNLEKQFWPF